MSYAMREYRAEQRAEKRKARLQAIGIIAGVVAIMLFAVWVARFDFCPLYYQIKCF